MTRVHSQARPAILKRTWSRKNLSLGLCRACTRPRAVLPNGHVLSRCEFHRGRQHVIQPFYGYSPPKGLLSLSAFSDLAPLDLAYAAGLIEGEGCITPNSEKRSNRMSWRPYCRVSVAMTDEEPVKWLYELFGGTMRPKPTKNPRHKDQFHWEVGGRRAGAVMAVLLKFLLIARHKRAAALVVKVSSIAGWWQSSAHSGKNPPEIRQLLRKLSEEAGSWRNDRGIPHR
ncbi:hypothetical protein LCGC14_1848460 [marine sediment metagenome]|uniref:Homing endonuclease LAGLIDADG domain-containing protein n=1 Tax=marine sediment metagenome TaxID=412755 RepID=A0A0F9GB04_9ZZZZ